MLVAKKLENTDPGSEGDAEEGDQAGLLGEGLAEKGDTSAFGVISLAANVGLTEVALERYREKAEMLTRSQDPDVFDRDVLIRVVQKQSERFYGCMSLPLSIGVFMCYIGSLFYHKDIGAVFLVDQGLRAELGEGLDEVNDIGSFWNFLNTSFAPKILRQTAFGERLEDKGSWARVLNYNQLQGPLAIKQMRTIKTICDEPGLGGTEKGIVDDMVCYPWAKLSSEDFGREPQPDWIAEPQPNEYAGGNVTLEERQAYYASAFKCSTKCDKGYKSDLSRRLSDEADEDGKSSWSSAVARRLREAHGTWKEQLTKGYFVSNPSYSSLMYPNTNYSLVQEQLNYLYKGRWLDEQTAQVGLQAILVNAELNRPRMVFVRIDFFFNRGGSVFTFMSPTLAIFMEFWEGNIARFMDFCYYCLLCAQFVVEFVRWRRNFKQSTLKKYLKTPKNALSSFVVALGGLCLMASGFVQTRYKTPVLTEYKNVRDLLIADTPPEKIIQAETDLIALVDNATFVDSNLSLLVSAYVLCLCFLFFAAFNAQPRLGVVMSTLENSLSDILHLIVVILPSILAFSLSGVFIFGRTFDSFCSFSSAFMTTFRISIEGEWDWGALAENEYMLPLFWIFTVVVMMLIVLLNMFVAIILEVYGKIRKNTGDTEAMWDTVRNMYQQFRFRKRWISNRVLAHRLGFFPKTISRDDLLSEFVFCEAQCNQLLKTARAEMELETMKSMELEESMKMAMSMKLLIDKLSAAINDLHEANDKPQKSLLEKQATELTKIMKSKTRSGLKSKSNLDLSSIESGSGNIKSSASGSGSGDSGDDKQESAVIVNRKKERKKTKKEILQDEKRVWLQNITEEMSQHNHKMLAMQWHLQQLEWQWQALEMVHGEDATYRIPPDFDPSSVCNSYGGIANAM